MHILIYMSFIYLFAYLNYLGFKFNAVEILLSLSIFSFKTFFFLLYIT